MASEERKAADAKIAQENLFKTLGAEEVQAETDAFQCGRCKQVGFPVQCMPQDCDIHFTLAEMSLSSSANSQR